MPAPGILTGGSKLTNLFGAQTTEAEIYTDLSTVTGADGNPVAWTPTPRRGVFGVNPGSTSKYALNRGAREAEGEETTARLFIEMPASNLEAFRTSVSPLAQPLASVLASATGTGGAGGTGFIDFLLTHANEAFQEKAQIVDTLTDNYVAYYAGQEPPVFGYNGVLLNTYQDDQRVWMLLLYREILRGSRLAHRNLIANLRYDSFIVSGYLESLNLTLSGETDNTASQFSFTMRVKSMQIITPALSSPTYTPLDRNTTNETTLSTTAMLGKGDETARNATVTSVPRIVHGRLTYVRPEAETPESRADTLAVASTYMKAAGRTDDEQWAALGSADANHVNGLDVRAMAPSAYDQAVARLEASAVGTDTTKSNVANINADGQNGASNVRGPERPSVTPTAAPVYAPTPEQSGLVADNVRAAQTVSNSAQGYKSVKAKLREIRKKRTRGRHVANTTISGSDGRSIPARIAK